eukprot:Skav220542  [mRNA]  locus=scaffold1683:146141:148012:- [translate_table: standard]
MWYFGIFRSPQQFVDDAVQTGHPISNATVLPSVLQAAIKNTRECDPHVLAKRRLATLGKWLGYARDCQPSESDLHNDLPPDLSRILKPKRLLVWKAMLEHYEYPDIGVFDEVLSGTTLTGLSPHVPCFEQSFKPAKITENELEQFAASSREAILWSTRSSGDEVIDSEVYTKTLAEVDSGWLTGPIPLGDLPHNSVINRRFGIKQTSGDVVKVRLLDDFSASGVNSSVQVSSMPKLHTLDIVAALSLELTKPPCLGQWVGKTVDLSSAYRQLGISPKSKHVSYVSVFNPTSRKPEVFLMHALPFGASRSVYSFLRVAHSLWWLGCVALNLTWSNFFDDYITFCRGCESEVVSGVISQFFRLLGWMVSDDKDRPFSQVFKALGVEISLEDCHLGNVVFKNTKRRVEELVSTITGLLDRGKMTQHEAMSLRGRMQFAKAQIWGRAPRTISHNWQLPWFIFTDASFQPDNVDTPCGLGGVLIDPCGRQVSAFSFVLDFKPHLEALGFPREKTVIFEAELLALILAMKLWGRWVMHQPCMFFVDNNSARDIAISGHARTEPGASLMSTLLTLENSIGVLAWFARVPSESNIADAPSRCSREGIDVPFLDHDIISTSILEIISKLPSG